MRYRNLEQQVLGCACTTIVQCMLTYSHYNTENVMVITGGGGGGGATVLRKVIVISYTVIILFIYNYCISSQFNGKNTPVTRVVILSVNSFIANVICLSIKTDV